VGGASDVRSCRRARIGEGGLLTRVVQQRLQPLGLRIQLDATPLRQGVRAPPTAPLGPADLLDETLTPKPLERRIERAGPQDDATIGSLLDLVQDRVPVPRLVGEREHDVEHGVAHDGSVRHRSPDLS
jgi:hypothetical protein